MTAPVSDLQFTPGAPGTTLRPPAEVERAIVIRTPSGLSGDMLLTGLSRLAQVSGDELERIVSSLRMPQLDGCLSVEPHSVHAISGWKAEVSLRDDDAHRSLKDIVGLIDRSEFAQGAKNLAARSFRILAEAEARVHGIPPAEVHFHEVGALDSILDLCVASALFHRIGARRLVCSPLPMCDGTIRCEHGLLASPAPAVQEMLKGVSVYGVPSRGETVTPTALAFLKGAGAIFGEWPSMTVEIVERAYGGRIVPGIPNGAIFALGTLAPAPVAPR